MRERAAMKAILGLCAVALCALARPAIAAAGERPRIAILDLIIEGDAPPELRPQLDRSLAGGLYAAGYEVVGRDEVARRLKSAPELVGCQTTTCLERIGQLVDARRFVRVRVEASGAAYTFELELYSADIAGGVVNRVERSCSVCTIAEANDEMSRAATDLKDESLAAEVNVLVQSDPPGATVMIDGKELGVAPLQLSLAPGPHLLRLTLPGRLPVEQTVTVEPQEDGAAQEIAVALPRAPGGTTPRGSRFGVWKWAAAGGGAVALVTGLVLISMDGDGTNCDGGGRPCRDLYDTLVGGVLLTGVGAGLGGASAWMFLHDSPPAEKGPTVGLAPTPAGGAAVWLRLSF